MSSAANYIEETDVSLLKRHEIPCDKYDYLIACGCGAIGGMIDIFLVGAPGDSVLGKWTDAQVDNAVKGFAKVCGWNPKPGKENSVASAIGWLEGSKDGRKISKEFEESLGGRLLSKIGLVRENKFHGFGVNYDQRHTADVGNLFNMSTKNHHMKSLAHSPDPIGLFFSILNQFTSTSSFLSNGQLITISSSNELQGGNLIAKVFCGFANWLGHIMSDIAGSSGGRGSLTGGRGSGVCIPFFELFQLCDFGKFPVGKHKQDLATIATRAFQEGYDFRFGLAMAIPVLFTELTIRLSWSLRRYFQYNLALKDCWPFMKHESLRVMLLCGHGTLCVIDGLDAGIRSGGNYLLFFLRINIVAWYRFIYLVIKELCIRFGLVGALDSQIEAYKLINEALLAHLAQLEAIDKELFIEETTKYRQIVENISAVSNEAELSKQLMLAFKDAGIELPWHGDFDTHMSNPNGKLVFK